MQEITKYLDAFDAAEIKCINFSKNSGSVYIFSISGMKQYNMCFINDRP